MFFVRNEGEWCNMHAEARRTLPSDRNTSLCSVVLSLLMPMVLVHDQVLNPVPEIPPCSAYLSELPMICLDFLERDGGTPKTLIWFELGRQAPQAPCPLNKWLRNECCIAHICHFCKGHVSYANSTEPRWLFLAHFLLQPVQCWSSVWLWALRHMTEWLSYFHRSCSMFTMSTGCFQCSLATSVDCMFEVNQQDVLLFLIVLVYF